jgi:hypothetical protein
MASIYNKWNITFFKNIYLWLISWSVTRVTRRVPLVEQELPILPEHLSSLPIFSGVHVTWSFVLCVMFCRSLFVLLSFFFLAIVLSVLRFMDSDYPFGILLTSKFKKIVKSPLSSVVMNVFQRNLFFSTCLGIDGFNGILILSVKNIIKILVFYIACSVIFFFSLKFELIWQCNIKCFSSSVTLWI